MITKIGLIKLKRDLGMQLDSCIGSTFLINVTCLIEPSLSHWPRYLPGWDLRQKQIVLKVNWLSGSGAAFWENYTEVLYNRGLPGICQKSPPGLERTSPCLKRLKMQTFRHPACILCALETVQHTKVSMLC